MKSEVEKAFSVYLNRLKQSQPENMAKLDDNGTLELFDWFKRAWSAMSESDRTVFWNHDTEDGLPSCVAHPNQPDNPGVAIVRKAPMATHESGAVREDKTGRGAFHLIPPCAELALAKRFEDGAKAHGPNNWQKGLPLSTYYNAARRHMMQAARGDVDEDHFGAALWNLSAWMWTAEEIKAGRLPAELNDLPYQP